VQHHVLVASVALMPRWSHSYHNTLGVLESVCDSGVVAKSTRHACNPQVGPTGCTRLFCGCLP